MVAGLTVVDITVGEGKRALTVALAASPVAVIHSLAVGKHETLATVGGGIKVGHSAKFFVDRAVGGKLSVLGCG